MTGAVPARECIAHAGSVPAEQAIVVGAVEGGTAAGRFLYACPACVASYSIVKYDDHPPLGNGLPMRRYGKETRPFLGRLRT